MGGTALALGAMTVATGVVGDLLMGAPGTAQHMAAKLRAAAGLDRRHYLELGQTEMALTGLTPVGSLGPENVSDLQAGSGHGSGHTAGSNPSNGLSTSCSILAATWV